jgi:hypothetical protein
MLPDAVSDAVPGALPAASRGGAGARDERRHSAAAVPALTETVS